jgi:hypothetical protein
MVKYTFRDSKVDPSGPLRIDKIQVLWIDDDMTTPDFLGEYTDDPGPGAEWIDRFKLGDGDGSFECRYFVPSDPENGMEDYRRYEAFNRGEWHMEGCVAHVIVSYPIGGSNRRLEKLSSGGLWGIESDSGESYKLETELEQLADLKKHVEVFNVPWSNREETFVAEKTTRLENLRREKDLAKSP